MVPSRVRRVTHARAEADLLQLLPDGPAKNALALKLEVDVLTHVKLERNRRFNTGLRIAYMLVVFATAVLSVGSVVLVGAGVDDHPPAWLAPTGWGLIATGFCLLLAMSRLTKWLRSIADESHEEAEDESSSSS